ncbi:MAG: DUF1361 domain-containing protein [Saprospiraceae bacterium]|nr:DUF1361 domain-containing protein [Saprospiraceae bacterium]MCB9325000.1 DUF1361 domain-containing protein [Lewinellaceae bacterium]
MDIKIFFKSSLANLSKKQQILSLLVLNSGFNGLLLLFRLIRTEALFNMPGWHSSEMNHSPWFFMFLAWNLFLAWIPFLIAYHLERIRNAFQVKMVIWAFLLVWLLFLPNAPYLVTDLVHLKYRPPLPLWYDMILLFSFAWTGLLLGFFSLVFAGEFWAKYIHPRTDGLFVFCSLLLCSFGIYIGRFQRWNSWDILTDPANLIRDIFDIFLNPVHNLRVLGITAIFFCLLSLGYLLFKTLIKHHE